MESPGREPIQERHEWRLAGVVAFALFGLLLLAGVLRILWPFLTAICLAVVTVILTNGLYERLRARLRGRKALAAVLMLAAITFLVVLPAFGLVLLLVAQADGLVERLQDPDSQRMLTAFDLPARLQFLTRYFPSFDPSTLSLDRVVMPVLQQAPGFVARHGGAVVGGLASVVVGFLLVLLASYYLYVEGRGLLQQIGELSPLPERYDRRFADKLRAVIEATFRGQVMTSLAQGSAVCVGLLIARVPGAFLWAAVAAVLSLLPLVGSAVVWVPATIYLGIRAYLGNGSWGWAIFLALWGVLVVSTIDNVVRPWVMKGKAELPAIPLLFAVLGGLQAFGFVGLVIGPLILGLVKTAVDIYRESFTPPDAAASAPLEAADPSAHRQPATSTPGAQVSP